MAPITGPDHVHPNDDDQRLEKLWYGAQARGLSRRAFLTLMSAGGAAAVLSACGMNDGGSNASFALARQEGTPEPTPDDEATPEAPPAGVVTTVPERIHVKPIVEEYFIPHGTSIETRPTQMQNNSYTMDTGLFFVRNHAGTPVVDQTQWRLRVEGNGVQNELELSYEDLLGMPSRTVTRFVECAGNCRALYDLVLEEPAEGTQWLTGGYGIATWTGVPLADILEQAGIQDSAVSIMATSLDEVGFRKPLPVEKAMQRDTMVVWGMNGAPLPYDHGFPARLLVPGWVGAYNVKWLWNLEVADEQQYSTWNTTSYVLLGPEYPDPEGPPEGPIITDQTVKSIIALPWPATLSPGRQRIFGYAWSPFATIAEVEVSIDDGQTFQQADLIEPNIAAAGVRWEYEFDAQPGEMTIVTRATDDQGNQQWPVEEQVWNEKGYIWGAVIPHPVTVEEQQPEGNGTPAATATPEGDQTPEADETPEAEDTPEAEETPEENGTPEASQALVAGALAMAGREVYLNACAECHGEEGQGVTAPTLIGPDADLETYQTARGLYDYISSTMPLDNPGSLSDQEYLEVTAYLLLQNDEVGEDERLEANTLDDIDLTSN